MAEQPTFERCADATLDDCRALYQQRGGEYSDTWDLKNSVFVHTRATLDAFGITLTPEQMRLLQVAGLCDVKASRLIGKWKDDSIKDGINYQAVYCTLRNEYEAEKLHANIDSGQSFWDSASQGRVIIKDMTTRKIGQVSSRQCC